jgi:hypothetical protein
MNDFRTAVGKEMQSYVIAAPKKAKDRTTHPDHTTPFPATWNLEQRKKRAEIIVSRAI